MTIFGKISSCTNYEQLAHTCYEWAKNVGIDLDTDGGTYTQLARWWDGQPEGAVFLACDKRSDELAAGEIVMPIRL